jgi:hypothetical protein
MIELTNNQFDEVEIRQLFRRCTDEQTPPALQPNTFVRPNALYGDWFHPMIVKNSPEQYGSNTKLMMQCCGLSHGGRLQKYCVVIVVIGESRSTSDLFSALAVGILPPPVCKPTESAWLRVEFCAISITAYPSACCV